MSDLLGGTAPSDIYIGPGDKRAISRWYLRPYLELEFDPQCQLGDFTTQHWPGSGGMSGDAGDVNVLAAGAPYTAPDITRGSAYIFAFIGVTRDAYGSPVGGVTVSIFHTSDQRFVNTVVSDPSGNFAITTPYYPDNHFLVFYKAGTPDIFATTVNTLVGS